MKLFLIKLITISILISIVFSLLLFAIPKDNNAYLCEYNKKIDIIKHTPSPRVILIGASTLAFNIDSKQIADSIGYNVINMGLHAGIGAKYYLNDYIQYIKKGDIVVISPSYYADFSLGGNGTTETMIDLMVSTGCRNLFKLNFYQYKHIIEGIPFFCFRNIVRFQESSKKGWNTPSENEEFKYTASGFNKYGDEQSHWSIPYRKGLDIKKSPQRWLSIDTIYVDRSFVSFLRKTLEIYSKKTTYVFLMPEIRSELLYKKYNPSTIVNAFNEVGGLRFLVPPDEMVFPDSLGYDEWGSSHFCRKGVTLISDKYSHVLYECMDSLRVR